MTADLSALIARLEAAKVGSRELDWHIAEAFDIPEPWKVAVGIWPPFMERSKFDRSIPAFTTSLDAALALAEMVLPGWQVGMWTTKQNAVGSVLREHGGAFDATASNPALALVIAILRAKQGEGK